MWVIELYDFYYMSNSSFQLLRVILDNKYTTTANSFTPQTNFSLPWWRKRYRRYWRNPTLQKFVKKYFKLKLHKDTLDQGKWDCQQTSTWQVAILPKQIGVQPKYQRSMARRVIKNLSSKPINTANGVFYKFEIPLSL